MKGGEEEARSNGGGHQETGDALPAAAEVWKGKLAAALMLMLTSVGRSRRVTTKLLTLFIDSSLKLMENI